MISLDTVDTHRLRGERVRPRHWGFWWSMGADPVLMATQGGAWAEEQAREKLLWNCDQWARHGHGQWLFFLNPSVVALTLVGNRRPERVMQKLGFSFEAEITHAGLPHVLYRLAHPGHGVERSVDLPGGPPSAHP